MTRLTITHPLLGTVDITLKPGVGRFTGRWRNGTAQITAPQGASRQAIARAVDSLAPRMLPSKPHQAYVTPQRIECHGVTFVLSTQSHKPDAILARPRLPETTVAIGSEIDLSTTEGTATVSRMLCRLASRLAEPLLIPYAEQIADRLGIRPAQWRIASGHRVLGSCSSNRVIRLSYLLVFLPLELRQYIICHELAHLTEMNHSPRFHELCNAYCNGNERELAARLKSFNWPILR